MLQYQKNETMYLLISQKKQPTHTLIQTLRAKKKNLRVCKSFQEQLYLKVIVNMATHKSKVPNKNI